MTARRRVLLVSPYPPTPPLAGGRRRVFEMARWLAPRCDLTLASVVFNDDDERQLGAHAPAAVEILMARPCRHRCTYCALLAAASNIVTITR